MKRILLLPVVLVVCLGGCPWPDRAIVPNDKGPAVLQAFESAQDFRSYWVSHYEPTLGWLSTIINLNGWPGVLTGPAWNAPVEGSGRYIGGLAGSSVQDQLVNDPDKAKTDGSYVYSLANKDLVIARAAGGKVEIVGQYTSQLAGTQMVLHGGEAVIVSRSSLDGYGYGGAGPRIGLPTADLIDGIDFFNVDIVDVRQPAAPQLAKRIGFQGDPVTWRIVGDKLHLVFHKSLGQQELTPLAARFERVEEILPRYRICDANAVGQSQPLVSWQDMARPANPDGWGLLVFTTIDLADPDALPAAAGMVGFWGSIYLADDAVYVTNCQMSSNGGIRVNTDLHKFDWTEDKPRYAASGRLEGRYDGSDDWGVENGLLWLMQNEGASRLMMVRQAGTQLETAGTLAPLPSWGYRVGEKILSIGDYQFTSIDPVGPQAPQVISGENSVRLGGYLRGLDQTHVLSIGLDGGESFIDPWPVVLQILDVSSTPNVTVLQDATVENASTTILLSDDPGSLALHNGYIAMPVAMESISAPQDKVHVYGASQSVCRISLDKGFELLGQIEVKTRYIRTDADLWCRPIFVDDMVYIVTNTQIVAASLNDIEGTQTTVDLPQ